jgi:DNA helicase-2/ATP-dependent DNA helicase PcrA
LQIKNLMARSNLSYSDFAVFMRVNALSRAFEQEFMKYGIPCKVYGGFKFFERKEIKDILSYLKIINNTSDDESFLRCVATPKRGIGDKTLRELREFCLAEKISLFDGVSKIEQTTIGSSAKQKLKNFVNMLKSFMDFSKENTVIKTIENILEITGFEEQFSDKTEENDSKLYNISELRNSAVQFEKENKRATLSDYLNSVTLSSDTDEIQNGDAVTIATIHAVKGLEYKCVFIAGLDEHILPIARNGDGDEDLEEERRLMYVAVTRAMERLYLTRAMSRYMYGRRENMMQSRFLREAQTVLSPRKVDEQKPNGFFNDKRSYSLFPDDDIPSQQSYSHGYSSGYAKSFLQSNKPKEVALGNVNKYKTGVKVRHSKFGEGVVINVKGVGDNLIIDVAFSGVGIKSLSAKYAPLEII